MTDRFHSITVVLDQDVRSDDAEGLIAAICNLRGVLSAAGNVADLDSHMAEQRAKHDLGAKLFKVIYPDHKP